MPRSPSQPGAEHVFMSKQDQAESFELFKRRFSKRLPEIRRRLDDGLVDLEKDSAISMVSIIRQRIPRGLIAIIDEVDPIFPDDKTHAYFFLNYFMRALAQSDAKEVKLLEGRLSDALNYKSKFCALFWELAVANTYMSHGNKVDFIPPSKDPTPEMIVHGKGGTLWIECKCLSVLSRPPISEDVLHHAIDLLGDIARQHDDTGVLGLIRYKGGNDLTFAAAISDLQIAADSLLKNGARSSTEFWDLEISFKYPEITNDIGSFLSRPREEKPEALHGFSTVRVGERSALVFFAESVRLLDELTHSV